VAHILRAEGHEAHAPTLTGQGERAELLTRGTDLGRHVADVRAVLFYEDLRDVALVGHSYGSMVAEQVADLDPDRIAAIVHLHGFVPRDGESLFDVEGAAQQEHFHSIAAERGAGWLIPVERAFVERWGIPPQEVDWVLERLTPFPIACQEGAVQLRNPEAAATPRTYLRQSGEPLRTILAGSEERARERGAVVEEIDAQHDSMLTHPAEVAAALVRAAERAGFP
jgi:pimeloyl-ACP methyl ester carboxylesterase